MYVYCTDIEEKQLRTVFEARCKIHPRFRETRRSNFPKTKNDNVETIIYIVKTFKKSINLSSIRYNNLSTCFNKVSINSSYLRKHLFQQVNLITSRIEPYEVTEYQFKFTWIQNGCKLSGVNKKLAECSHLFIEVCLLKIYYTKSVHVKKM